MSTYSLSHLADHVLLRDLAALVARDRATTAELLAHIAEVDARKLYRPAAYPSMFAYCVGELRLSEEAARKRIHAARKAREIPAIFTAVAEGRLSLSSVVTLAPHLTQENADELLAASTHKTRFEIEQLIAERAPRLDVPTQVEALTKPTSSDGPETPSIEPLSTQRAPGRVASPGPRPRVEPLAPERYALQVTVGQATYDKLRHAQALLAHALPSGELSEVLDRALDALIERLEKRKFEATARPRNRPGTRGRGRHVPAEVKRAVRERDGGQCTFVSASGRRCEERRWLEFDHVHPVARGGEATLEGVRLRCRAHNQYTAECTYGAGFMQEKRDQARRRTEEARRRKAAAIAATPTHSRVQDGTPEPEPDRDVTPWLRSLGYRAEQARHGAALCEAAIPEAPIEQKLRFALGKLTQGLARKTSFAPANPA